MNKKRVFVVRKGRQTGIFQTWEECEAQVAGIAGAQFRTFNEDQKEKIQNYLNEVLVKTPKFHALKANDYVMVFDSPEAFEAELERYPSSTHGSFAKIKEAYEFLGVKNKKELLELQKNKASSVETEAVSETSPVLLETKKRSQKRVAVYVAGRFTPAVGTYSSAFLIIQNDKKMFSKKRLGINKEAGEQAGSVAGEMAAVMMAVEFLIKNNIREAVLFHVYPEIQNLLNGQLQASRVIEEQYVQFMKKRLGNQQVDIIFKNTKGKTKGKWNDAVDLLAASALFDFGFDSKF